MSLSESSNPDAFLDEAGAISALTYVWIFANSWKVANLRSREQYVRMSPKATLILCVVTLLAFSLNAHEPSNMTSSITGCCQENPSFKILNTGSFESFPPFTSLICGPEGAMVQKPAVQPCLLHMAFSKRRATNILGNMELTHEPINGARTALVTVNNDSGLIGWWMFNEGNRTMAYDSSGYQRHCTIHGNATWMNSSVSMLFGRSIYFDGVDDYIEVSDSTGLDAGTSDFSVSAWVKLESLGAHMRIASKYSAGAIDRGWSLLIDNVNRFVFTLGDDNVQSCVASITTATENIWYYVVGVRANKTLSIYVNGELEDTVAGNASDSVSPNRMRIGINPNGIERFHGVIDEVRVYRRALGGEEIWQDYNRDLPELTSNSEFTTVSPGSHVDTIYILNLEKANFINIIDVKGIEEWQDWIAVLNRLPFTFAARSGNNSIPLRLRISVPEGTASGTYSAEIVVDTEVTEGYHMKRTFKVPIRVEYGIKIGVPDIMFLALAVPLILLYIGTLLRRKRTGNPSFF